MAFAGGLMAMMGGVQGPQGFDPPKLVPMSAMLAIGSLTLAGVVAGSVSRAQGGDAAAGRSAAAGVMRMLRDLLQEAYNAMRHNRRRTALTMLGMAWGIATVVMLLAYGDGFGQACANIFANFGTKLVIVVPGKTSMQAGGQKSGAADPLHAGRRGCAHHQSSADHPHHARGRQAGQRAVREPRRSRFRSAGTIPMCMTIRSLEAGAGTLLQHGGPGTAGPRGGDRVGSQGETVFGTQCAGRTHPRWMG